MQIVERALGELKRVLYVLDFTNWFLDALLIFVIILLFCVLLGESWIYALLFALGYLLVRWVFSVSDNKYLIVEKKVHELNEQLRTVADNIYRTNPILDSLKEDVVKNMKKVKTSYFINEKFVTVKVLIICLLAFFVVFASFMNINFNGIDFSLPDPLKAVGIRGYGKEPVHLNFFLSQGNLSDLLGNKSLAELGSKEFQLVVNPLESDVDLSLVENVGDTDFSKPNFPKEIYTRYDVAYNEQIAKENQKVVRSYFDQIIR